MTTSRGAECKYFSAPSRIHQKILVSLITRLGSYLEGKTCELYSVPFDVYLIEQNEERPTIVQPDIVVICDPNKFKDDGCHGASDTVKVNILDDCQIDLSPIFSF